MVAEPHPEFVHPSDANVKVWRFMGLAKFLSMLNTKYLYFARSDKLGDPFEGSITFMDSEIERSITEEESLARRYYPEMTFEAVKNMYSNASEMRKNIRSQMFINCWHMNDHESAAMWKLYGEHNESVCIQSDFISLNEALPKECHIGIVKYISYRDKITESKYLFTPFLYKRKSFEHEREIRAIFWKIEISNNQIILGSESEHGIPIPVSLDSLIHNVFVSPAAPPWFRDVVEDASAKYNLAAPVHQSSLTESPIF